VDVTDLKAVDITGVNPTKTRKVSQLYLESSGRNYLPLLSNALKVEALIPVFCINTVWVDQTGDIVLLDNNAIEIDKGFSHHVQPFVGKTLGFFMIVVLPESGPC
jgi:hypothetical protein